ncbi:hypothetical protein [Streptomyces uncialis]|uniref:Uncharacterized protein n=1 Tax=Streptomyces uncialis TaxID=1048205 RepID=A0A1Q4V7S9_9ACTN|nr:hypothetical protein [Streptomyces uncialis]MCX4661685.1 hypothetical protein [Streptomyces uncialis]OKH93903.1 hypothetical protein AB852_14490 [Streptomyces uncialis]WST72375.1 hypothetical protein OG268_36010 [Streptomyces uncialis]WTE08958.1 hypothetical protein OG924_00830 [Streptomyces uncialis]
MTTTDPQRFTVLLVPEHVEGKGGATVEDSAVRSAVVEATGETGASGYPRYAGNGIEADIDPRTRTVEALLVDGKELVYGLTAKVGS